MNNYKQNLTETANWALDQLYQEITNLPTQYLLDTIDSHDCHLDSMHGCECIAYIRELTRRMKRESEII